MNELFYQEELKNNMIGWIPSTFSSSFGTRLWL